MKDAKKTKTREYISKKVRSTSPSGIRKFFDILNSLEGVISLGVGEPDYITPWHIREAGIYALEKGYTSYTSNYGLIELREELARSLKSRMDVDYDPTTELLITVGVSEGLDVALRAILDPGDEVIIHEPGYVSYTTCIHLAGGVSVPVPTTIDNDFKVKAKDIEAMVTPMTKAIILGYPSNPTGAVMDRKELLKIAEIAERYDLIVISDEVYERLVYGIKHANFASLPGMRKRTIYLSGFSKSYAMTGWRIGYAAAPAEFIEAMMKVHQYTIMCAPTIAQMAALEALRQGETQVQEMVDDYNQRRRLMVDGLNRVGLPCHMPHGAFYAFPSIKATGMSSDEFAERLLREARVAVVPGSTFGSCGEGYIRCCYATSMAEIEEALERIDKFVRKHRP
ncbi:MAG: aminotransferase class I/II-fold pyridoxal phosphate-dependent enzyme [Chloroflexota bacterium]|nr:aminotransferase class I/II-fold pyridoxal phosphate-dependent enzyme [Chloroflexota bacterium]